MEASFDVMIDVETMANDADAALLSLGAVLFDPWGQGIKDTFYKNIELKSCMDVGLSVNADTMYWWLGRSDMARREIQKDRVPLSAALSDFSEWFRNSGASKIWSHGATFDFVVLDSAFRALSLRAPYRFRDARDTRTLFDLADYKYVQNEDTAHHALHDAQQQAEAVQNAYRILLGTKPTAPGSSEA